jgi:hypothetical protein
VAIINGVLVTCIPYLFRDNRAGGGLAWWPVAALALGAPVLEGYGRCGGCSRPSLDLAGRGLVLVVEIWLGVAGSGGPSGPDSGSRRAAPDAFSSGVASASWWWASSLAHSRGGGMHLTWGKCSLACWSEPASATPFGAAISVGSGAVSSPTSTQPPGEILAPIGAGDGGAPAALPW